MWNSPDNQHAAWQGHWTGWVSLVDQWTQGLGWVCLLLLVLAWHRGGRLRWMLFRLFLIFLVFATVVSIVWSSVQSHPMNYNTALYGGDVSIAGRYLYSVLLAWFVAGFILLLRTWSGEPADSNGKETMINNRADKSCEKQWSNP